LNPKGLPTHCLYFKVGALVVLLRNLNVADGLCNGTRFRNTNKEQHIGLAKILV
jgi:PIF1-like helicase